MTTTNAFIGQTTAPTEEQIGAALGRSRACWDQFAAWLAATHTVTGREWKSYSPKAGWSLRLKRKQRTIVHLAPRKGGFMAAFILGERAMKVVRSCEFPDPITALIKDAVRYPEGTAVRIPVEGLKKLAVLKQFAVIKIEN